ncbi:MAG: hypothetical protein NT080_00315 [Spirochaetes bacterium]|nr:hypothetical protein [Spirochaetota bacterium]
MEITMTPFTALLLGALVPMIVGSLYTAATTAFRKRISIKSRSEEVINQVIPAVNALLALQGPQTEALVALLEATMGTCNGNVERALESVRRAQMVYQRFKDDAVQIEGIKQ